MRPAALALALVIATGCSKHEREGSADVLPRTIADAGPTEGPCPPG